MDISEVLERKKAQQRSCEIILDADLLLRRDRLLFEIKVAEKRDEALGDGDMKSGPAVLRQQLEDLDSEIQNATVTFKFEALPRKVWNDLVEGYLQLDESGGETITDEFMMEVVLSSCVEPVLSRSDVERIFDEWSMSETDKLYLTAFAANRESRSIPFTEAGTVTIPSTGSKSTTAESGE